MEPESSRPCSQDPTLSRLNVVRSVPLCLKTPSVLSSHLRLDLSFHHRVQIDFGAPQLPILSRGPFRGAKAARA